MYTPRFYGLPRKQYIIPDWNSAVFRAMDAHGNLTLALTLTLTHTVYSSTLYPIPCTLYRIPSTMYPIPYKLKITLTLTLTRTV